MSGDRPPFLAPSARGDEVTLPLLTDYRARCRELYDLETAVRGGRIIDRILWSEIDWQLRREAVDLLRRVEGLGRG